jgi:hypothetical protein
LAYWEGFRKLNAATMDAFCEPPGSASSLLPSAAFTARIAYHWHKSWPEAEAHRRQLAEFPGLEAPSWTTIVRGLLAAMPLYLRPSPVPWMRALFDPIDWSAIS